MMTNDISSVRRRVLRRAVAHVCEVFDCGFDELEHGIKDPSALLAECDERHLLDGLDPFTIDEATSRVERLSELWHGRERVSIVELAVVGLAFDEFGIGHDGDEITFDSSWSALGIVVDGRALRRASVGNIVLSGEFLDHPFL